MIARWFFWAQKPTALPWVVQRNGFERKSDELSPQALRHIRPQSEPGRVSALFCIGLH
jgi:hypothetical protein